MWFSGLNNQDQQERTAHPKICWYMESLTPWLDAFQGLSISFRSSTGLVQRFSPPWKSNIKMLNGKSWQSVLCSNAMAMTNILFPAKSLQVIFLDTLFQSPKVSTSKMFRFKKKTTPNIDPIQHHHKHEFHDLVATKLSTNHKCWSPFPLPPTVPALHPKEHQHDDMLTRQPSTFRFKKNEVNLGSSTLVRIRGAGIKFWFRSSALSLHPKSSRF